MRWTACVTSAATSDGRRWGLGSWMATSTLLNSSSAIMARACSRGYLPKQSVEHATYTAPSVRRDAGRASRSPQGAANILSHHQQGKIRVAAPKPLSYFGSEEDFPC